MNKKSNFTFIGNGRENPSGLIINIGIMLEKVPKECFIKKTFNSGNTYTMLYATIKRKLDKQGNGILDNFGNSHYVVVDDWKIAAEKEKGLDKNR